MPEYYKYAERTADSQINWAQVGAEASGMLAEVNRVRQEKKDALEQGYRESMDNLMNSPQGVDQSINSQINDFAHNMIEQKKLDYDLLKRGQMNVRDYTLKVQNQMDGTKNLFKVSEELQKSRQTTFDGIADGSLQSTANIFNKGFVEKMSDLSKLGINVNSPDGSINVGLYEDKVVDGKKVRVLSENITTPNVLLGMVAQNIPTFYTDKTTTDWVKNMGDKKAAIYQAATTSRAGTISEYLGPEYLSKLKDPAAREIAINFNKAIDSQVDSAIGGPANSYNLMGVIAEDLGKNYNFTYNKKEAEADKNKILVMVNQSTGQMDLDPKGANYDRMKKEAFDFVKGQVISKLDADKKISTIGQLSDQDAEWKHTAREKSKEADTATNMIGKLWYGNDNEVGSAVDYFKGLKNDKGEILFTNISRDNTGVNVTLANGSNEHIDFLDKNGKPRTQRDFIASAGPLLAGQVDVSKSLEKGAYQKNRKFNVGSVGQGTTITPEAKYQSYLQQKLPLNIDSMPQHQAAREINKLASDFGLVAEPTGIANEVIKISIPGPNGTVLGSQEFKLETGDPAGINKAIIGYMTANGDKEAVKSKLQNYNPPTLGKSTSTTKKPVGETTVQGGRTR